MVWSLVVEKELWANSGIHGKTTKKLRALVQVSTIHGYIILLRTKLEHTWNMNAGPSILKETSLNTAMIKCGGDDLL
jgi:hypothetical protein